MVEAAEIFVLWNIQMTNDNNSCFKISQTGVVALVTVTNNNTCVVKVVFLDKTRAVVALVTVTKPEARTFTRDRGSHCDKSFIT